MAEPKESKKEKSSGGCVSKLLVLILLAAGAGLGAAVFFVIQPQDLTDLGGYAPAAQAMPERDMKVVLKNSIDRGYPIVLSEAEINHWLARTLVAKQGGFLEGKITLDHVWVRLEAGRAEIIMERNILGKPLTVSMYVQIERMIAPGGTSTEIRLHGGPFIADAPLPPKGGRFGKLVVPQGFLLLVMPAYEKLVALFPEEIELGIRQMEQIKMEKGRLVLNPRETTTVPGTSKTF